MDNILFFDGTCNLCNSLVDWLIRKDQQGKLKFASLQGETARKMLPESRIQPHGLNTVVFLRNGILYERSKAILLALGELGAPWPLYKIFLVVPAFLRDFVYKCVAKYRYRLFGKRETCRLPTAAEKDRLLP